MNISKKPENDNRFQWCHNPNLHRQITFSGIKKRIGPSAFMLYDTLLSFCREGMDYVWPSMQTIEEYSGLTRNTIRKAIHTLEENRMIKIARQKDAHGRDHIIYHFIEFWALVDATDISSGQNLTEEGSKNAPYTKQELNILNKYKEEAVASVIVADESANQEEIQQDSIMNNDIPNNIHDLESLLDYHLSHIDYRKFSIFQKDKAARLALYEYFWEAKYAGKIRNEKAWLMAGIQCKYQLSQREERISDELKRQSRTQPVEICADMRSMLAALGVGNG